MSTKQINAAVKKFQGNKKMFGDPTKVQATLLGDKYNVTPPTQNLNFMRSQMNVQGPLEAARMDQQVTKRGFQMDEGARQGAGQRANAWNQLASRAGGFTSGAREGAALGGYSQPGVENQYIQDIAGIRGSGAQDRMKAASGAASLEGLNNSSNLYNSWLKMSDIQRGNEAKVADYKTRAGIYGGGLEADRLRKSALGV